MVKILEDGKTLMFTRKESEILRSRNVLKQPSAEYLKLCQKTARLIVKHNGFGAKKE